MPKLELVRQKAVMAKKLEEYFNAIRTNIQFSGGDNKTIVLTSAKEGEGKSTMARNLAIAFARGGYRTLLIDADIRNSVLVGGSFKSTVSVQGLTSFLSGRSVLSEVISDTNVPNLAVIPAGHLAPNPTALLQNEKFKILMEESRMMYDYVIVDSPPIGLVIDAAIVAQYCDAYCMVAKASGVSRPFFQKAQEQMAHTPAQFLGVILNNVDETTDSYGSYGTSYGQYGQQTIKGKRKK